MKPAEVIGHVAVFLAVAFVVVVAIEVAAMVVEAASKAPELRRQNANLRAGLAAEIEANDGLRARLVLAEKGGGDAVGNAG